MCLDRDMDRHMDQIVQPDTSSSVKSEMVKSENAQADPVESDEIVDTHPECSRSQDKDISMSNSPFSWYKCTQK